jgi:hypothetical protein
MKWMILLKMLSYPMEKQKMIVAATMYLYNFIRENHSKDKDFSKCDQNPDYVPTIHLRMENILLHTIKVTHQLRNLMIGIWINSDMSLHGQRIFLDHDVH